MAIRRPTPFSSIVSNGLRGRISHRWDHWLAMLGARSPVTFRYWDRAGFGQLEGDDI